MEGLLSMGPTPSSLSLTSPSLNHNQGKKSFATCYPSDSLFHLLSLLPLVTLRQTLTLLYLHFSLNGFCIALA